MEATRLLIFFMTLYLPFSSPESQRSQRVCRFFRSIPSQCVAFPGVGRFHHQYATPSGTLWFPPLSSYGYSGLPPIFAIDSPLFSTYRATGFTVSYSTPSEHRLYAPHTIDLSFFGTVTYSCQASLLGGLLGLVLRKRQAQTEGKSRQTVTLRSCRCIPAELGWLMLCHGKALSR
jgi:hypothetical protein